MLTSAPPFSPQFVNIADSELHVNETSGSLIFAKKVSASRARLAARQEGASG